MSICNIFYCTACQRAEAIQQDTLDCEVCGAGMTIDGWMEHDRNEDT